MWISMAKSGNLVGSQWMGDIYPTWWYWNIGYGQSNKLVFLIIVEMLSRWTQPFWRFFLLHWIKKTIFLEENDQCLKRPTSYPLIFTLKFTLRQEGLIYIWKSSTSQRWDFQVEFHWQPKNNLFWGRGDHVNPQKGHVRFSGLAFPVGIWQTLQTLLPKHSSSLQVLWNFNATAWQKGAHIKYGFLLCAWADKHVEQGE